MVISLVLACLVELAWPAAWSVFLRAGLDVWVSSYTLVQAFFWWSSWADLNISALDLLEQSRQGNEEQSRQSDGSQVGPHLHQVRGDHPDEFGLHRVRRSAWRPG